MKYTSEFDVPFFVCISYSKECHVLANNGDMELTHLKPQFSHLTANA